MTLRTWFTTWFRQIYLPYLNLDRVMVSDKPCDFQLLWAWALCSSSLISNNFEATRIGRFDVHNRRSISTYENVQIKIWEGFFFWGRRRKKEERIPESSVFCILYYLLDNMELRAVSCDLPHLPSR